MKAEDFDDVNVDDEEAGMWHDCPHCGHPFDEIDFEYQRCHFCKHDANPIKNK